MQQAADWVNVDMVRIIQRSKPWYTAGSGLVKRVGRRCLVWRPLYARMTRVHVISEMRRIHSSENGNSYDEYEELSPFDWCQDRSCN